ncbi:hypothetical protein [Agrococcus citreus]|uniref:Lactococcin 972 family bacteriocin n=1 Tax=Agrococcus citreus TaxID=84643 RepID=A0ABN1YNY2_9MICO
MQRSITAISVAALVVANLLGLGSANVAETDRFQLGSNTIPCNSSMTYMNAKSTTTSASTWVGAFSCGNLSARYGYRPYPGSQTVHSSWTYSTTNAVRTAPQAYVVSGNHRGAQANGGSDQIYYT